MNTHELIPKRKQPNVDDRLIPLINIVFLLLIFFMIAGQITQQQDQSIQPPISESENNAELPRWLIELNADGHYRFNGEDISEADLSDRIAAIPVAAINGFTVKADRTVKAEVLDRALNLLRSNGIAKVTLLSRYSVD